MEHDRITPRQAYFLLALFFLGNLLTATGAKGKPTGWLSFVLLALLAAPMLGMTLSLAGRDPAGEILPQALGRGAGTAATVILCLLAILLAGDALSVFAGFIVANDLNNAGAVGNTLLLAGTCFLLVGCDGGTLGRMAWLIQPWTVLLLLESLALTAPYTKLESLLPLFTEGTAHFARATAVSFLTFSPRRSFSFFPWGERWRASGPAARWGPGCWPVCCWLSSPGGMPPSWGDGRPSSSGSPAMWRPTPAAMGRCCCRWSSSWCSPSGRRSFCGSCGNAWSPGGPRGGDGTPLC